MSDAPRENAERAGPLHEAEELQLAFSPHVALLSLAHLIHLLADDEEDDERHPRDPAGQVGEPRDQPEGRRQHEPYLVAQQNDGDEGRHAQAELLERDLAVRLVSEKSVHNQSSPEDEYREERSNRDHRDCLNPSSEEPRVRIRYKERSQHEVEQLVSENQPIHSFDDSHKESPYQYHHGDLLGALSSVLG